MDEMAMIIEDLDRRLSEGSIDQREYNRLFAVAERDERDAMDEDREQAHRQLDKQMGY